MKEQLVAVATDGGVNMIRAATITFRKTIHLNCFAHMLNLVAENVLKESNVVKIMDKMRDMIKLAKSSVNNSDGLRNKQRFANIPERCVKNSF